MNWVDWLCVMTGFLLGLLNTEIGAEIDCYVCSSYNGSDPRCADPFHPVLLNLTKNCRQGRQGRKGLFPARYCTKIKGTTSNGIERIIRSCAFETLDNMFGIFRLEGVTYTGWIKTCEQDACNAIPPLKSCDMVLFLSLLIAGLSIYHSDT